MYYSEGGHFILPDQFSLQHAAANMHDGLQTHQYMCYAHFAVISNIHPALAKLSAFIYLATVI